jgi:hypothetical protein
MASLARTLALASACALLPAHAQDGSRLLPESFAKTVAFSWRQDGRVVDVQITNPKTVWVLQQLQVEVRYPPVPPPKAAPPVAAANKPSSAASYNFEAIDEYLNQVPPQLFLVNVEVQPGQMAGSHIELKTDAKILSASLVEVRGREVSRLERMWNSLK